MIRNEFYNKFDEVYSSISKFLSNYCKSTVLQNFCQIEVESLLYGNLVNNFFINLNQENIKKLNLPLGKIGKIRKKFGDIQKNVRRALLSPLKAQKINEKYYNSFKLKIKKEFPDFLKIIKEIEKEIDINKAKGYLKKKEREIKEIGKPIKDFNTSILTKALEVYIQKKKEFPLGKKLKKFVKVVVQESLSVFPQEIFKYLKKISNEVLGFQRKCRIGFEKRLYKTWKEPLELLEIMVHISLESSEIHLSKLRNICNKTDDFKRIALIRIHARALQISNEIIALIKSGYADGAYARWRSLHELAVISTFLLESNVEVSERYLEHVTIKKFREATAFNTYCRRIGYTPIKRKILNKLKKEKERLCKKYNDKFQEDYGWIPSSILSKRTFKDLEMHVKFDKLRPFYNLSSDVVHGGAKGFYRLGLMSEYQDKILLVGSSNYGLADPMQNTAKSLFQISVCLLNLEPDFESNIQMQIMKRFVDEIGSKAVRIQNEIEKEELSKLS